MSAGKPPKAVSIRDMKAFRRAAAELLANVEIFGPAMDTVVAHIRENGFHIASIDALPTQWQRDVVNVMTARLTDKILAARVEERKGHATETVPLLQSVVEAWVKEAAVAAGQMIVDRGNVAAAKQRVRITNIVAGGDPSVN